MKYISDEDCCFEQDNFWFRYRAAAIIIEDGCVLMAYNDVDDYFYSIGGGVHLGETSEQAVIREVKEETGMKYEVERLAFIRECMYHGKTAFSGKQCHIVEFYYLMKPKGKRLLKIGRAEARHREYRNICVGYHCRNWQITKCFHNFLAISCVKCRNQYSMIFQMSVRKRPLIGRYRYRFCVNGGCI